MKIISHEDITSLNIKPIECYNWVKDMIAHKHEAILKPKISMKVDESGFYNTMPAIVPSQNVAGVKLVNRYSNRNPSLDSQIMLYDYSTGHFHGIMDANYITTMRTGAVAAYSIELLAKKNFNTVGFIGLGNTARACFKVLMAIYPNAAFTILLKEYKNQHDLFLDQYKALYPSITFKVISDTDELVKQSDVIVSSVTYTDKNLAEDTSYSKGCLVIPIHTRGFQNCDLFFEKVFGDDTGHISDFKYFNSFKQFSELTDVVNKKKAGRENEYERILAYNIGIAIHDIYFAAKIFNLIKNKKENLPNLNNLKDKIWVE